MVRHIPELQALQCSDCREVIEIPRSVLRDPDVLIEFKEKHSSFHARCAEYAAIGKAQIERRYRRNMARALHSIGRGAMRG